MKTYAKTSLSSPIVYSFLIILFILFTLLNGFFVFYYKNKFPNIEFYTDYFIYKKEKICYENLEYFFFFDVRGHEEDENIRQALTALRKEAELVRVLGSYPIAIM